jgi:hypothetical protein
MQVKIVPTTSISQDSGAMELLLSVNSIESPAAHAVKYLLLTKNNTALELAL